MNILAFHGSHRRKGNSTRLLHEFERGTQESRAQFEEIFAEEINLGNCKGCLRCNLIKRCAVKGDEWEELRTKILKADVLAFASPIYFHHLSAPLKKILDRFRSFMHVRITEQGLNHTPWEEWKKHFVLLLSLGSPHDADAKPVIDLFTFLSATLGPENKLHTIVGTRLAVTGQVTMSREELGRLYAKLELPIHLAESDYQRNQALLKSCYELGQSLAAKQGK